MEPRTPFAQQWLVIAVFVSLVAVLLLAGQARAVHIEIARKYQIPNTVPNTDTPASMCWWASAETIGRFANIYELYGLVEAVHTTGVGRDGAQQADIDYWLSKRGVAHGHGSGWDWIAKRVQAGQPVLAAVQHWTVVGTVHAVVVTGWSDRPETFDRGDGSTGIDRLVYFVDPNVPGHVSMLSLGTFKASLRGRAYVFAQRGAAMPLTPIDLPVRKYISSQDQTAKDGVSRPPDLIEALPEASASYDYYAEYRRKLRELKK